MTVRVALASVVVDDQAEALSFYTDVLGFALKPDLPGGEARWLTVVAPGDDDGFQLLLEPKPPAIAETFQRAHYEAGIAATSFASDDIHAEYERLTAFGVRFFGEPETHAGVTTAIFDDTCGNRIGPHQD